MEITCADCGCLVERGVVVTPCDRYPTCCCVHLPERRASGEDGVGDPPSPRSVPRGVP